MESTIKRKFATEQQLQAACIQWFWNTYPSERRMLHCNNNNSADRISGNKAKAVGVVAGVSDLELVVKNAVMFIELKLPGKKQSEEQIDFELKVTERGHNYFIVEYLEDFIELITKIYSQCIGK